MDYTRVLESGPSSHISEACSHEIDSSKCGVDPCFQIVSLNFFVSTVTVTKSQLFRSKEKQPQSSECMILLFIQCLKSISISQRLEEFSMHEVLY